MRPWAVWRASVAPLRVEREIQGLEGGMMRHKRTVIAAICVLLAAMMVFWGCSSCAYSPVHRYPFDGNPPLTPDDPEVDEWMVDLTRGIERRPESAPESALAYYGRGHCYILKGEYDKAISDFTKAIELQPDRAAAYNSRGLAYCYKGEYNKAISDYNNAIELDPKNAKVYYYNRGCSYHSLGEYDKAIADYTKAIELDPEFNRAYYRRGLAHEAKGEYDKAINDFEKVAQLEDGKLVEAARQALERIGE
ncbi:tetratricopeptide repeat protein [Chloroflexota bacterium]